MDKNFAFLIVTGAPDHTEFGIDLLGNIIAYIFNKTQIN